MVEVPLPPELHSFLIISKCSLALCHLASTKPSNAQQMCGCTVNNPGLEIRDLAFLEALLPSLICVLTASAIIHLFTCAHALV